MTQDYTTLLDDRRRTRKRQYYAAGIFLLFAALLWLFTDPPMDIDILDVSPEITSDMGGIDRPLEISLSAGSSVTDSALRDWAVKRCRQYLILPPVEPVPVIEWLDADPQTGRQLISVRCYRDRWSAPEQP